MHQLPTDPLGSPRVSPRARTERRRHVARSRRRSAWRSLRTVAGILLAGVLVGLLALRVPAVSRAVGQVGAAAFQTSSGAGSEHPANSSGVIMGFDGLSDLDAAAGETDEDAWGDEDTGGDEDTDGQDAGSADSSYQPEIGIDGEYIQADPDPEEDAAADDASDGSDPATSDPTSPDATDASTPAPGGSPSSSAPGASAPKPAASAPPASQSKAAPSTTSPPAPSPTPTPAAQTADATASALAAVNAARADAGCGALGADGDLATLAAAHSADMRNRHFFGHVNPDGLTPLDRGNRAGVTVRAENIAQGQPDAAAVVAAWMASPGHRANILNCSYTTMGLGMASGSGGPWWTQEFA